MAFAFVTPSDSVVWADTLAVTTDAYGLVSTRVGTSSALQALPWKDELSLRTQVDLGGGFSLLSTEPVGFVPVAGFAANGFYEQSPEDYRLGFTSEPPRASPRPQTPPQ